MNKKIVNAWKLYEKEEMASIEKEIAEESQNIREDFSDKLWRRYHKDRSRSFCKKLGIVVVNAAAVLLVLMAVPNVRTTASGWLSKLFHSEVRIKVDGKQKLVDNQDKIVKEGDKVTATSLVDINEWDYWNYLKEYELQPEGTLANVADDIPNGMQYQKDESEYEYTYEDHRTCKWNRTDNMSEALEKGKKPSVGLYSADFSSPEKKEAQKSQLIQNAVLTKIYKVWSGKQGQIIYNERVNTWCKEESYHHVKQLEKTMLHGKRAYVMVNKDGSVDARIYEKAKLICISIHLDSEERAMEVLHNMTED